MSERREARVLADKPPRWPIVLIVGETLLSSIVNVLSNEHSYRWVSVTAVSAALCTAGYYIVYYVRVLPPRSRLVQLISFFALALATLAAGSATTLAGFGSFLAVFVAVAAVLIAVLLRTDWRSSLRLLLAAATAGGGIAELGYATDALAQGEALLGWSWIIGGIASICTGIGVAAEHARVIASTYLVGGVAFAGVGIATLPSLPVLGWSFVIAGVAGIIVGVVTMNGSRGPLPALAYVCSGVTVIGAGMAMLALDDPLLGIVCLGFGIIDLGGGLGVLVTRRSIAVIAFFAGGFLAVIGGLMAWLLSQPVAGAAAMLVGAAFTGYAWIAVDGRTRASALWEWLRSEPDDHDGQAESPVDVSTAGRARQLIE